MACPEVVRPVPPQRVAVGAGLGPLNVLVFAHTPPPWHGQSAMVKLMLDLLNDPDTAPQPTGVAPRIRLHHVNARLSRSLADVGDFRLAKLPVLLRHCASALWVRWRHSVPVLYYVPAPPARAPVFRDWIVMALCRPFFKRLVLHWHAGGLSHWLETEAHPLERALTRWFLARPDLSLVLRPFHRRDAEYFDSRRTVVLSNGIADPCPDFDSVLRPDRERRSAERRRLLPAAETPSVPTPEARQPVVFRVVYLSSCGREKGIFDLLDAIPLANRSLERTGLRVELTVAGEFWKAKDRSDFTERLRAPDLAGLPPLVRYAGFIEGAAKDRLLRESDCVCLPTCLPEGFPVVLVEAMAYGVPPITTNWCGLAEVLPSGYPGVVEPHSPTGLAAKLVEFAGRAYDPSLRAQFLANYTARRFAERLRDALGGLDC